MKKPNKKVLNVFIPHLCRLKVSLPSLRLILGVKIIKEVINVHKQARHDLTD